MAFDAVSFVMGMQKGKASGGGSSGGGSLPPGAYLSASEIPTVGDYLQRRFYLNGEFYTQYGDKQVNCDIKKIYKWNGSSWTMVCDVASIVNGVSNSTIGATVEPMIVNGKAHYFYTTAGGNHTSFDGTNYTVWKRPSNTVNNSCTTFVHNGTIWVTDSYKKIFYSWDESTDTWTQQFSLDTAISYAYSINGVLYMQKGNALYRYENGTLVKDGEFLNTSGYSRTIWNGKLYTFNGNYAGGSGRCRVLCYDPLTHTDSLLGYLPSFSSMFYTTGAQNFEFLGLSQTYGSSRYPYFVMNIVKE